MAILAICAMLGCASSAQRPQNNWGIYVSDGTTTASMWRVNTSLMGWSGDPVTSASLGLTTQTGTKIQAGMHITENHSVWSTIANYVVGGLVAIFTFGGGGVGP